MINIELGHVRQTHCYACKKELVLEFPDQDPESEQYENAVRITFSGGYGMFVESLQTTDDDDIFFGDPSVIICHECAHELCEKVPWIECLLDPFNSHSHSYDQDWSGHKGWDLPHKP